MNSDPGMEPAPDAPDGPDADRRSPDLPSSREEDRRSVPLLDGPLERATVSKAALSVTSGLLGLAAAFILFQLVISPMALLVQIGISTDGMGALQTMSDPAQLLGTYTRELIVSNGVGQVLGLALPALLLARLHSSRVGEYLRIRSVDGRFLLLAAIGVVGLQPVVQWMAQVNQNLPLPETIRTFEQSQMELIQNVLEQGLGVSFNLVMMALIPAICEEILFRGYAQRQFERGTGAAGGVLLSGVLFGLYHLRPSQLLPLTVLGLYLAYLTWRTNSLWPAVLVHLLHNGIAVLAARYVRSHQEYDFDTLEQAPVPWYGIVAGFVIFAGALYIIQTRVDGRWGS